MASLRPRRTDASFHWERALIPIPQLLPVSAPGQGRDAMQLLRFSPLDTSVCTNVLKLEIDVDAET